MQSTSGVHDFVCAKGHFEQSLYLHLNFVIKIK